MLRILFSRLGQPRIGSPNAISFNVPSVKAAGAFTVERGDDRLHPHDIRPPMNDLLLQLRDKGNTVLVVEHKPEAIAIADHVIDLGPEAGRDGGRIFFEGTPADLVAARSTLTGEYLAEYVGT